MAQRVQLLIVFIALSAFSCEQFYKDDFQLNPPPEERITVSFPGLVEFEVIQTVIPDNRGLANEVSNTFVIANAQDRPLGRLKFGINIFDSEARFASNLEASYVDSIRQPLGPLGVTDEKLFNNRFSKPLLADMMDIFILGQDVSATHPFSGIYTGEAIFYAQGDTAAQGIPFVSGAIDYQGNLVLRTSGNYGVEYTINGRVSTAGQFTGQIASAGDDGFQGSLKNETGMEAVLQNDSLHLALVPGVSPPNSLVSIALVLTRD